VVGATSSEEVPVVSVLWRVNLFIINFNRSDIFALMMLRLAKLFY